MDTETLTPTPKNVKDPCLRCKGTGRVMLAIHGRKKKPKTLEIICCHCGGDGEKRW